MISCHKLCVSLTGLPWLQISKSFLYLGFVVFFSAISIDALHAQSEGHDSLGGKGSGPSIRKSEFLVELKARQLSEEHNEVTKKRKVIQEILGKATVVRGKLQNHTVSIGVTETHISDLNSEFDEFFEFISSNPTTLINESTAQLISLRQSYDTLTFNWRDATLEGYFRELRSLGRRDGLSSSRSPDHGVTISSSLFETAERQSNIGVDRNYGPLVFDKLSDLLFRRGRDESQKTGADLIELSKGIKSSLSEVTIGSLTKVIEDDLSLNQKIAETFETLLKSEEAKHKNILSQLEIDLDSLNSQLIGVERTRLDNQSAVNEGLIKAVYMMIGSILVMFLALRVFNAPTAQSIIEKRALVELVGISFLLITIIILGTGDKIEQSALAALLGTIAGYVFGRGVGPQPSQEVPKPTSGS